MPRSSRMEFTNADKVSMLALLVSQTTGTKSADPATDPADLVDDEEYKFNLRAVTTHGVGPQTWQTRQ